MDQRTLLQLAKTHGTPLVVVDHKVLRENYAQFGKYLPRVQVYYAVKANADPAISHDRQSARTRRRRNIIPLLMINL